MVVGKESKKIRVLKECENVGDNIMDERMRISYRPLWVLLATREMSKKDLREISGISTATLAKLGKGDNLTTDMLLKICEALHCNIGDIVETVPIQGTENGESDVGGK